MIPTLKSLVLKKLFLFLGLLLIAILGFSQITTFNNGGGDNLWSNNANWSNGIANGADAKVTLNADAILDMSATVAQIKIAGSGPSSVAITNQFESKLTITGNSVTQPIQINKNTTALTFNLPVIFDSSEDALETMRFNSGNIIITFGAGHSLTLKDKLLVTAVNNNNTLNINGSLLGSANFNFGAKCNVFFGTESNNSSYTGSIRPTAVDVEITANTSNNGTFIKSGAALDIQNMGAIIIVNGSNTLKGNILVGDHNPTLNINANQNNAGLITMGSGTLELVLAEDVNSMVFIDNSSSDWGTGTLAITGASDNEVIFGTNSSGITSAQLSKISLSGSSVEINSEGKLSIAESNDGNVILESTFNNGGGDNVWSNASNWSAGIPNISTAKVTLEASVIVDSNIEIAQIKLGADASSNVTVSSTNSSVLTINGVEVTQPIQNNKADLDLNINLAVVLSSSDVEIIQISGGGSSSITFGANSELTLNANTKFIAQNDRKFYFDGILRGSGQFLLGAASTANFDSTSDNTQHTGGFKMLGNDGKINVNTQVGGIFLNSGATIAPDVSSTGHNITVNTANVFKGNISVLGNPLNLNINANQSAMGTITMTSGILNLLVAPDVTSISFVDNSSADWGTGTLAITGAEDNEVAFGTNNRGLTSSQISQTSISGSLVEINSQGQLFMSEDILDKKGIAMSYKEDTWPTRISRLKPFWHYSWSRDMREQIPEGVEFVPMFWGAGSVTDDEIARIKSLADAGKIKYVLGFNEPDLASQANMTIDEAIALWPKLEEIGVPLGSPVPAGLNNGWLEEFMRKANTNNLRVDFINIHLYRENDAQIFLDVVDETYQKYGKPIWITEMSVKDNQAQTVAENRFPMTEVLETMKVLLPELYNREYISRFAWFTATRDSPNYPGNSSSVLYDENDNLTILGEHYAEFKANPAFQAKDISESTFTNQGGDKLWSNSENWSNGIPNVSRAKVTLNDSIIIDSDVSISQIKLAGGFGNALISSSNSSTLTINGIGVTQAIQNNGSNVDLKFNLKVVISSSELETIQVNGGGTSSITFGSLSDLALNATTKFAAQDNKNININGILQGQGQFQIGAASKVNFGSTSNNKSFQGGFKLIGNNGQLEVNTAKDSTFLSSGTFISTDENSIQNSVKVNSANVLMGNISVNGATLSLDINANQTDLGTISIVSGILNLALDSSVTSVIFADNSSANWGTGKVAITGAGDNEIVFGTNYNGLSSTQVSQINMDNRSVTINSLGQISAIGSAQVTQSTFTNEGGDNLWSNAINWSDGIPNVQSAKVILNESIILDMDVAIAQIKMAAGFGALSITGKNDAILKISGFGVNQPIQNNAGNQEFLIDLPVVMESNDSIAEIIFPTVAGGIITFGSNSSLLLNSDITINANKNAQKSFNFNGILSGSGNFQLDAGTVVNFGSTSDNSAFTGNFVLVKNNGALVSNIIDNGVFLPSGSAILSEGSGGGITVNGINTFNGNILLSKNDVVLNINANQSSMGVISIIDSIETNDSNLELSINNSVSAVQFINNSSSDWDNLSLKIIGFKDNLVSFGTSGSGLTEAQLSKIDIGGPSVTINSSGQLEADGIIPIKLSTFNNAGGDMLWSNPNNWTSGIPNDSSAKVTLNASVMIDMNVNIAQIKLQGGFGDVVVTGSESSVLNLTGIGVNSIIQNNGSDVDLMFDLPLVISSTDAIENIQTNAGGMCSITFGSNSNISLNSDVKFSASGDRKINMSGILKGSGQFQIGTSSTINFGSSSDNDSFMGGFKMLGNNSELIINTASNATFLKFGIEIMPELSSTGHSVTLNSENVFYGNLTILDSPFNLNINANQSDMGIITMGSGILNLILNDSISSLAFAKNSSADWGTGTISISGFQDNLISFGNDSSGLSLDQIKQINYEGGNVIINEFGYLITADNPENDEVTGMNDKKKEQVFFPNPNSSAKLKYSFENSIGDNIVICDLEGKSYIHLRSKGNFGEIDISHLYPGVYVIMVQNIKDETINSILFIRR